MGSRRHYFGRPRRETLPSKRKSCLLRDGENDLWIDKRTPDQIYADFVQFMRLKEKSLGATPVWYISAKPSKQRFEQLSLQSELNAKVKALADQRDDLAYIDVVPAMLKPDGTPKDIFVADNLHMTPEGSSPSGRPSWTRRRSLAGQRAKSAGMLKRISAPISASHSSSLSTFTPCFCASASFEPAPGPATTRSVFADTETQTPSPPAKSPAAWPRRASSFPACR